MGSKGGGTNTVTNSKPPAEVLANYREVTDQAKTAAATPYTPYGGQLVAGISPTQQAGIQGIQNAQGAYDPYAQTAQGYISNGTQQISPMQFSNGAVQQYMSPYTQNVIDATMANANIEDAKQQSSLQGNAIARGAWGGDRADLARNDLARNQALARNQTIAGLENQNYAQALNQFNTQQQTDLSAQGQNASNNLQGAGLTGALGNYAYQNQLGGAGALINAGGIEQQTNQNDLNAQYQQFQQAQAYPFNTISWLSGITSGLGSQMGGTSSTQGPAPNGASSAIGGGLSGAGMASMMGFGPIGVGVGGLLGLLGGSDERIKEDINKVGKLDNGLPVYTFRYKNDPETRMGVMAQDVEKKNPEIVGELPGGIKTVDYTKVAKKADGGGIMNYGQSWVPEIGITPGRGLPDAPPPPHEDSGSNPMGGISGLASLLGGQGNSNPMAGIGEKLAYGMNDAGMGNQAYENLMRLDGGFASGGIADMNDSLNTSKSGEQYVPMFGETVTNPMAVQTKLMERGYADGGFTPIPGQQQQDPMQEFFSAKNNFMAQNPSLVSMSNQNPADIAGADPNNNFGALINQSGGIDGAAKPSTVPPPLPPGLMAPQAGGAPQQGGQFIEPPALDALQGQLAQNAPKLDPAMAALAAGAAMMGGESPYFGVNVGKGISAGLKSYTDQQGAIREYALKKAEVQKQAQQLATEAARYNKQLEIEQQNADTSKAYKDVMAKVGQQNADTKAKQVLGALDGDTVNSVLSMKGPQAYKALKDADPTTAEYVNSIANAQTPFPTVSARNPQAKQVIALAKAINPDISANSLKAVQTFNTGKQGEAVRQINSSYGHMITLGQLVDEMGSGDVQRVNAAKNQLSRELGGTTITNYDAARNIVGNEMTKFLSGIGGGTLEDRDAIKADLDAKLSTGQKKGALDTYKELYATQLKQYGRMYHNATGLKNFDTLLSPEVVGGFYPKPSEKAIAHLKDNPESANMFRETFGVDPGQYLDDGQ